MGCRENWKLCDNLAIPVKSTFFMLQKYGAKVHIFDTFLRHYLLSFSFILKMPRWHRLWQLADTDLGKWQTAWPAQITQVISRKHPITYSVTRIVGAGFPIRNTVVLIFWMLFPFPYLRNDKTTHFHIFRNKTEGISAGFTEDILEKKPCCHNFRI